MDIQKIKKLYDQNQNLTEYFKTTQNKNNLSSQEIELIYDLQSGNYSKKYENNISHKEYKNKLSDEIVNYLNNLNFKFDSILEAGIGEGTTFVNIIQKLNILKLKSFGVDISWSRLAYANKFLKKHSIKNVKLATGLLENLPFLENSVDIVYTAHSIEPNGGKEKEILKELFRVAKNYLILLEPSYEFGNNEQKERMDNLSYAKNLSKYCEELGYKIIKHELLKNHSVENNKTEIVIIEKSTKKTKTKDFLACPETKTKLFKNKNFYYSAESFYSYPILENIICLNSENKILSTKLEDFITLDKTHPKYNETMFLRSLEEPIDEEKIKDVYKPNCIGFLATEENLEDEEFVGYIKELMKRFPFFDLKICYLDKQLKTTLQSIFHQNTKLIKHINEIGNIGFFIHNHNIQYNSFLHTYLLQTLQRYRKNIYTLLFTSSLKNKFMKDIKIDTSNFIIKNLANLNISRNDLETENYEFYSILYNKIIPNTLNIKLEIDKNKDLFQLRMYEEISFILKYPKLKEFFFYIKKIQLESNK